MTWMIREVDSNSNLCMQNVARLTYHHRSDHHWWNNSSSLQQLRQYIICVGTMSWRRAVGHCKLDTRFGVIRLDT